ncbi:MAG: OmpA family protein [Deltaproteobacteria bacterium]
MKIAHRFLFVILISMFLFGCGDKTAGIEGKIVDGKGKPVPGVSMIFKQVQPTQGYEQFEAKTGADGSFRLTGAAPSSDYIITVLSDKWKTKVTKKIKTLEAGQNLALSDPIKIRFNQMKDGSVVDTKTGLQWLIYPASDVTAGTVIDTTKNIKEGGFTDWRLPSRDELAGLQEEKIPAKTASTEPVLINKTCCAWVAEAGSAGVDWKFYVEEDNELWASSKISPDNRIVVVRNISGMAPAAPVAPAQAVQAPAVEQAAAGQPAPTVTAAAPAAKPIPGVRSSSRKACAEKRAQAAKPGSAAPPAAPTAAPTASIAPNGKMSTAKVVSPAPAKMPEPARTATPAKTNDSSMSESLYFDAGSATLKAQELAKLKGLTAKIRGGKGSLIVDGHSDASGSSNLLLSIQRSSKVIAALNKMGLGKNIKVELRALGDSKPVASNDTAEGRKMNRRVEVSFIPE